MVYRPSLRSEKIITTDIENVMKVMRCIIFPDKKPEGKGVIYTSTPVTTGLRMYKTFENYEVSSVKALNRIDLDIFANEILIPNNEDGLEFGKEIISKGYKSVIMPVKLGKTEKTKKWGQEHYLALWEPMIEEHSDIICFNRDYQYSNGCVEELLLGIMLGKELWHRDNLQALDIKDEAENIWNAITYINCIGADPKKLVNLHRRIKLRVRESYTPEQRFKTLLKMRG